MNADSVNVPATDGGSKRRGKGSSKKRNEDFRERKNQEFAANRRSQLEAILKPALSDTYLQYQSQHAAGVETTKPVPATTRGVGFHVKNFEDLCNTHLPRVERPHGVSSNVLYRYALMQLGRTLTLTDSSCMQSRATRVPVREKVSAFTGYRNYAPLADAISQVGTFMYEGVKYSSYVPDEWIHFEKEVEEEEPIYEPQSPDPTTGTAPPKKTCMTQKVIVKRPGRIPNPYFITIQNLRAAVIGLSDPSTPLDIRNLFISRNPIPGAIFSNGLLVNGDEIMPSEFSRYRYSLFNSDMSQCDHLFDMISAACPDSIGAVAMDGKGNELTLASVLTSFSQPFRIENGLVINETDSYMTASMPMSGVARLRSWVALMNEAPVLTPDDRLDSRYGRRSPDDACFTMTEVWSSLVWNVSPFRKQRG